MNVFSYHTRVMMAEAQRADRLREAAQHRLVVQARPEPARREARPSLFRALVALPAMLRPRKLA